MPLEQLHGQASESTDLYALGMTLIRLASRMEPHDMEVIRGRVQFERHVNLSPRVLTSLKWMIEPLAEDRPANVEALFLAGPEPARIQQGDVGSLVQADTETTGLTLSTMSQAKAFLAGVVFATLIAIVVALIM